MMLESFMFLGMGLLAGCGLTLAVIPLVHDRAVRLTMRRMQQTIPASVTELHAQRDLLRAEYAMTVRRLEISAEQARASAASARVEVGRKAAEVSQLKIELGRATALLLQLHARAQTQREAARRIVKLVVYLFNRSRRERRPIFLAAVPRARNIPDWMAAAAKP